MSVVYQGLVTPATVTVDRTRVAAALPSYELGAELGTGAYGTVLAGRHRQHGRQVAIKIFPSGNGRDAAEAQQLPRIEHQHILRVHDYVEIDDMRLVVMALLAGTTLTRRAMKIAPEGACAVGLAVAAALSCAHAHGVLHRDLKSDKMLFDTTGMLKVADFGIAKIIEDSSGDSTVVGTPAYMSPEQIIGDRLGPATDLYSLGALLYHLLTGVPPFDPAMGVHELWQHHLNVAPDAPAEVPAPVANVVLRALAKDPASRQPSAHAFALDLAEAAAYAYGPGWTARSGVVLRLDGDVRAAADNPPAILIQTPAHGTPSGSATLGAAQPVTRPAPPPPPIPPPQAPDPVTLPPQAPAAAAAGAAGAAASGPARQERPGEHPPAAAGSTSVDTTGAPRPSSPTAQRALRRLRRKAPPSPETRDAAGQAGGEAARADGPPEQEGSPGQADGGAESGDQLADVAAVATVADGGAAGVGVDAAGVGVDATQAEADEEPPTHPLVIGVPGNRQPVKASRPGRPGLPWLRRGPKPAPGAARQPAPERTQRVAEDGGPQRPQPAAPTTRVARAGALKATWAAARPRGDVSESAQKATSPRSPTGAFPLATWAAARPRGDVSESAQKATSPRSPTGAFPLGHDQKVSAQPNAATAPTPPSRPPRREEEEPPPAPPAPGNHDAPGTPGTPDTPKALKAPKVAKEADVPETPDVPAAGNSTAAAAQLLGRLRRLHTSRTVRAGILAAFFALVGATLFLVVKLVLSNTGGDSGTSALAAPQAPAGILRPLGHIPIEGIGVVTSMEFAPTGNVLATGSGYPDWVVHLWDVADPAAPRPLGKPLTGHDNPVTSVAFAPDGTILATANDGGSQVWEGDTLVAGARGGVVKLWDVSDPAAPRLLSEPLTGNAVVGATVFSPDGATLAVAVDGTVRLWDVTEPAAPRPLGQPLTDRSGTVNAVAFSPAGTTLATSSRDIVQLWDVADPAAPRPLSKSLIGGDGAVNTLVFAHTGTILAAGSFPFEGSGPAFDATLRLWDVTDPAVPRLLGEPLAAHQGPMDSMLFSPDGTILATSGLDGTIQLWDMVDPADLRPLGEPLAGRMAVFSPDGTALASDSNADSAVWLWAVR